MGTSNIIPGQSDQTLVEHWNGTTWSVRPSPDPSSTINVLQAAAATSRSNAWAVGYYNTDLGETLPLILHWNGAAWTQMASSITNSYNYLTAVSAVSATDVWAVGRRYSTTARAYQTLILHWNGTTWTQQPSPAPGAASFLFGVAATSATNAWAVGYRFTATARRSLILHWNGTTWTKVPSPNPGTNTELSSVTATSSSDAWAAGTYFEPNTNKTLIDHWNGTTWTEVPSPSPGGPVDYLFGIAASSATNAWAVGDHGPLSTAKRTLVEHWNGTAWTHVPSPSPSGLSGVSMLSAVAAGNSTAGAVGAYYTNGTYQPFAHHL